MQYDPRDWYWAADDGRVFSSARQTVVGKKDKGLADFVEAGGQPTPWPCDDAGSQTNAVLQDVLAPYGLWIDLATYAADARWRKEVGGIVVAGVPIATDDRSKLMITGARVAAMADQGWSTVWHGADGRTYPVNAAAMIAISDAVQAHVNAGFATFATVKAAIEGGDITTTAEVDAAFAV